MKKEMKLNLKFETMLDNIRSGKLSFEDIRNEVDEIKSDKVYKKLEKKAHKIWES